MDNIENQPHDRHVRNHDKSEKLSKPTDGADYLERNIASIHHLRRSADARRKFSQVLIDRIAYYAGMPMALYAHLIFYAAWIGITLFLKYDHDTGYGASASEISLAASVEAIFLALLVLINQRRMNQLERKHSDVHLQMSLLAEHEITRLARVTDLIARKLEINPDQIAGFDRVKEDVLPEQILSRIYDHELKEPTDSTKSSELEDALKDSAP